MFADDIRAAAGVQDDLGGLPLIVNDLDRAQRFVIGNDVVAAAKQLLCTRPSTLIKSLPLCRLPYEFMWLEWEGEHAVGLDPAAPIREHAHKVKRMGCFIVSFDKGQSGMAYWAWQDPEGSIAYGGLGMTFAFTGDVGFVYEAFGRTLPKGDLMDVRAIKRHDSLHPWKRYVDQSEVEAQAVLDMSRHAVPTPSPWIVPFLVAMQKQGITYGDPIMQTLHKSWEHDISGEAPFLFALLMLINAKNSVERVPSDLSRLNKARVKNGKPPKYDHSVTRLSISRGQARVGAAYGMDRQAVRKHLVRGHFKIRHTGVYWWSPFTRGGGRLLPRHHYEVTP